MSQTEPKRPEQWTRSRRVRERIYISGKLALESPTHLGNGDASGVTDIGLLRDEVTGKPLLTGSSLAGALRNYVREFELGYGRAESGAGETHAEQLFGYVDEGEAASIESWLMIDDALGILPQTNPIEIRDGVALDPATRTAAPGQKYDIELLAAGTIFPLHLEVWLTEQNAHLLPWLALALRGLEQGEIHLGMRKRRGFGRCRVTGWRVHRLDMSSPADVVKWLDYQIPREAPADADLQPDIAALLDVDEVEDKRERFQMTATFALQSSLLIRADSGDANAPDMAHLTNAAGDPVLPGTSLAGSMRARAARIARTVQGNGAAIALIDSMFGRRIQDSDDDPSGSRVVVQESVVKNPIMDRVQNRVKIDRFTGGAFPQALFSQMPLFARTEHPTTVQIQISLRKPADMDAKRFHAEVGLLLLVLKDLWTADLPLGGERSVGRGRLQGRRATLTVDDARWKFEAGDDNQLIFTEGKAADLEKYVTALHKMEAPA